MQGGQQPPQQPKRPGADAAGPARQGMPNFFEMFAVAVCLLSTLNPNPYGQILSYGVIIVVCVLRRGAVVRSSSNDPLPALGIAGSVTFFGIAQFFYKRFGFRRGDDAAAIAVFKQKLENKDRCILVGVNSGKHDAGAAAVEVSLEHGIRLISSSEEERFSAKEHDSRYPASCVSVIHEKLKELGCTVADITVCCAPWDYLMGGACHAKWFLSNLPYSAAHVAQDWWNGKQAHEVPSTDLSTLKGTPAALAKDLGIPVQLLGIRHHDSHAYMSYAASPFYGKQNVIVLVMDGAGDDGSTSIYATDQAGKLVLRGCNRSFTDSIGGLFSMIASTQGGWSPLSAEGRYMGAAAWGDQNRLTNPFYMSLRQVVTLAPLGQVMLNREMGNWSYSRVDVYNPLLEEIFGEAIPPEKMWNTDSMLDTGDVESNIFTQKRCDKAAALQLVFEDCIFHQVRHLVGATGSNHLIWTGGCALNSQACLRLLQTFGVDFYKRLDAQRPSFSMTPVVRPERALHLWVPPFCGDAGTAAGACYAFAMKNWPDEKAPPPQQSIPHPFFCGLSPSSEEIERELESDLVQSEKFELPIEQLADLAAFIVSRNGVIGLFQGVAEIGPRALGHRTILGNPTNSETRKILNDRVKVRERVLPLTPMLTLKAAKELYELESGASDSDYDAYRYMGINVKAKPEAKERVPAVLHADGSSALQLVREGDGFAYAYLQKMGERCGVECSVNISLNIGSPTVQTPPQAIRALLKSAGMHGILFIVSADAGSDARAFMIFPSPSIGSKKECGQQMEQWLAEWRIKEKR